MEKQRLTIENYFENVTDTSSNSGDTKSLDVSPPKVLDGEELKVLHESINKNFNGGTNALEVTVTVKPELLTVYHDDTIHSILEQKIHKWIVKHPMHFIFIRQYSEVGRMHWHGIVQMQDKEDIAKFQRLIRQHIGLCHIRQIRYWQSYLDYITRDDIKHKYIIDNLS